MSTGGSSDGPNPADTQPPLPNPYPVGDANGSSSAIGPVAGSLTDSPNPPSSVVPMNTNTFLPTLTTRSPHGNSSRVPGRPSANARSAASAFFVLLWERL